MKHLEITWLDSHAWSGGWMTLKEALEKAKIIEPIKSTGYLIAEDEDYLTIVQNAANDNVSMLYKIPKGSIKKKKEL